MYAAYANYKDLQKKGLRAQANAKALEVIEQYHADPCPDFAGFLVAEAHGGILHFELFRHIVYPVLKERYAAEDPRAIELLINTIQNVYRDREIHSELGDVSELGLLRQLLVLEPQNAWARSRYLHEMVTWLRYTIHEWPAGVLYGIDGAQSDECDEILAAVEEVKELDTASEYSSLLEEVKSKTIEYKRRLANKGI